MIQLSMSWLLSLPYSLHLAQCNHQSQNKSRINTQQQKGIYLDYQKYCKCCHCVRMSLQKLVCMHECTNTHTQISLTETEVEASRPWKGVSRIPSLFPSVLCIECLRDCFVHSFFSMHLTFVNELLVQK